MRGLIGTIVVVQDKVALAEADRVKEEVVQEEVRVMEPIAEEITGLQEKKK